MHGSICTVRTKYYMYLDSAQILFVIGTVVAMLVNTRSSIHECNQEADRAPKRLSQCDLLVLNMP